MPKPKTLLIFGAGKLGGAVVDSLANLHRDHKFVLVSRNAAASQSRANLSRYIASGWGNYPTILGEEADLNNLDQSAELIEKYEPDIVFNATTPFPWWKLDKLPSKERVLANCAGPGVWSFLDCLLPFKLTQALNASQSKAVHVNGCYPDLTNAFLASFPTAPSLGIGNISNLVPGLKLGFASALGYEPKDIGVQIVGHHYVSWNAPSQNGCADAEYDLTITYPGGQKHFSGPDDTPFKILRLHAARTRGLDGLGVTISSAATVLDELLGGASRRHHSPGALGLPGGYPIRIDEKGDPTLDLPDHTSFDTAVRINSATQHLDGIADVKPNFVKQSDSAKVAFEKIVGFKLPNVTPGELDVVSSEIIYQLNKRYNLSVG